MRHYRYAETGEIVRHSLTTNAWYEMRCDASTGYEVKWQPCTVKPEDVPGLTEITLEEASQEQRDTHRANSAARSELLSSRTHVSGGQWPGPFPV